MHAHLSLWVCACMRVCSPVPECMPARACMVRVLLCASVSVCVRARTRAFLCLNVMLTILLKRLELMPILLFFMHLDDFFKFK